MLHIILKRITNAATWYHIPPPPTLGIGPKGQDKTILEHDHVAYRITVQENHGCSNMVENILPAEHPTPTPPTLGSVGQNLAFSEHGHVAYQIKGNHQMQQHGRKYFVCCPLPDPMTLLWGSKGQNSTFFRTW